MVNTVYVLILLTWILRSHQFETELKSLIFSRDIISKWRYSITPCLVDILNDTAVSMTCSSQPSMEEVWRIIYQHVCHPQDIRAIRVNCYPFGHLTDTKGCNKIINTTDDCWCGEAHFESLNGLSKFSNIHIFRKPKCHKTQIKLYALLPTSFELLGLNISKIDFGRLTEASIIVLHMSLTTPPSLQDLLKLQSLRLFSIQSPHFASILEYWEYQSTLFQSNSTMKSCIIELLDLEIIESNIAQIPDRIFTIISVKVSLSLSYNIIQTISEYAFFGLTSLRALYLNCNTILHIHNAAFKTLTNLNTIELLGNKIKTLDTNIFINMNGALPFASSGIMMGISTIGSVQIMLNLTITGNKLYRTAKYKFFDIDYREYVKYQYINNEHNIPYSFIVMDYTRVFNFLYLNTNIYNYLKIYLSGNPLVLSEHPCFVVDTADVEAFVEHNAGTPCFCNIRVSGTESTRESTDQHTIDGEQLIYMNETYCEASNVHTPGKIALASLNIKNISVLQHHHKTLVTSAYININLSDNNITVLAPSKTWLPYHSFINMSKTLHITCLDLSNNGLTEILPGAWINLAFDNIILNNNNLMNITEHTFENLDTFSLSLNHNKLQHIHKIGLRNIKNIKTLILSNNMIHQLGFSPFPQTLIDLESNNNNLTNVNFDYEYIAHIDFSVNQLTHIDRMTNKTHIFSGLCIFQGNMITYIEQNAFQSYLSIDYLDLSQNYIELNFTNTYFDKNFSCGFLNLSNNHITSTRNLFYHAGFRRIKEINLSHNYITEIRDDLNNHNHHAFLEKLHMAYNKITYISPNIFQNMGQFIYADFRANRLHYFYFMPTISHNFVVDFTQNVLHCSCHLRWLIEKELWHKYKVDFCKDLVSHRQVKVIDVPLEDFVCETSCTTEQCDCYGPHANHSSHVTCSGRGLTEVPYPLPPLIQILDISHNYIQYINTFTFIKYSHLKSLILSYNTILIITLSYFNPLTNLKKLCLDHNHLEYVSFNLELNMQFVEEIYLNNNNLKGIEFNGKLSNMLPSLRILDISNNQLPYINRSLCQGLTDVHNLWSLMLHDNEWDCTSCNALYFRFCLSHNYKFYDKVSDISQLRCVSGNSGVRLLSVPWSNNVCTASSQESIKTFSIKHIILIVITAILVTVAVFICPCSVFRIRYAKYFRVISQHLSVVFHNDKTHHPLPEDQYDAILVYDSEDEQVRQWVVQSLLQCLEQDYGYKIMIEERDGPVGCFKGEANYMAIRDSQRTIVVLSQHFHQDKWKQDAVNQAFLCWKNHNKRTKLIFVAYDTLLEKDELMDELRVLVFLRNYISCLCIDRHDRRCWRKLRQKMPQHANRL